MTFCKHRLSQVELNMTCVILLGDHGSKLVLVSFRLFYIEVFSLLVLLYILLHNHSYVQNYTLNPMRPPSESLNLGMDSETP
jgi:hypothetical protein